MQDSWTVKQQPHASTLGVRTENEHVPSFRAEFPGIEFGFGDKIAPRLGFAYDIKGDGKWKTYGSFGRYFDITKLEMPRGSFGADHWITYYWTLDTFDWPNINCQEGPTGCPGTFIEQVDLRHPANEPDPAPHGVLRPRAEHDRSGSEAGADRRADVRPRSRAEPDRMSVGVRYTHKWLDRTIEDSRHPGPRRRRSLLHRESRCWRRRADPAEAGATDARKRSVTTTASSSACIKRLLESLVAQHQLHLEPAVRQLRRAGELGRERAHGPNVDRYFDGLYLLVRRERPAGARSAADRSAALLQGAGRPTTCRGAPRVGAVQRRSCRARRCRRRSTCSASARRSSTAAAIWAAHPSTSQIDLFLQHDFRLFGQQRFNVNLNVDNLFDQDTISSYTTTPWRDNFSGPCPVCRGPDGRARCRRATRTCSPATIRSSSRQPFAPPAATCATTRSSASRPGSRAAASCASASSTCSKSSRIRSKSRPCRSSLPARPFFMGGEIESRSANDLDAKCSVPGGRGRRSTQAPPPSNAVVETSHLTVTTSAGTAVQGDGCRSTSISR